jgi:hypothetical protein
MLWVTPPVNRHAVRGQEGDLLMPGLLRRVFDGDVVQRLRPLGEIAGQHLLDQRDVVVMQLAIALAAVEAHPGARHAIRDGATQGANMAEAEKFGPEAMGFLEVPNVEDDVIQAARRLRLGC